MNMQPGPELDKLVVIEVMGWHWGKVPSRVLDWRWAWCNPDGSYAAEGDWAPSRTWTAAGHVVEKLADEGKHLRLLAPGSYTDEGLGPQSYWSAHFCFSHPRWGHDSASSFKCETAPHAISLAALKTKSK